MTAFGAYGALSAPEFTRRAVEQSVMGTQLFGQIGDATAPFGNGNTYPGVYDALGRTIFFGTTLKF